MGLVIGVSACVGCAYAVNKKRKSRKKKKKEKEMLAQQEGEDLRQSGGEEGEYDERGEEYLGQEVTVQIHSDVISDISHGESLRKRKKGRSVETENTSKAKPHKETTRRMKLQEEADRYDVTEKSGSLKSQRSNGTPSSKSKKNYKHVELSESTSEDEGVDLDKSRVYVKSNDGDDGDEREDVYPITRNLRLSIRQSESGNTVFKIYASDKKIDNTNLRSTTEEITV